MNHLIIGAGPAGVIAAETLRRLDRAASITVVGNEKEPPYSRMAIPYLLAENVREAGTHLRHGAGHYAKLQVDVRQDEVTRVDTAKQSVTLAGGESLSYDRLLIATGSHTLKPPIPGMDLPGIENCWTLSDARSIMKRAKPGARVVLMGAGFIGCIVLEALVARKVELTVIEMANRMLARMMDEAGGEMIKRWCEQKGVRVLTSSRVTGVKKSGKELRLDVEGANPVDADLVVCATGVAPNVAFLKGSGIEIGDGILVDHYLRTNVAGVYAAGDVAQGPVHGSEHKEVHAIQPTASEHGRIAARNMAGLATRYGGSLPMNVLNTIGLVSSSYGQWMGADGGQRAVAIDKEAFKYLRLEFQGDRLVGALALGLTQHVGVIRGLVQTGVRLGRWKDALLSDPHQLMNAYLACTQEAA
jgi:NAD(P)H-nitrite reductase large subunit